MFWPELLGAIQCATKILSPESNLQQHTKMNHQRKQSHGPWEQYEQCGQPMGKLQDYPRCAEGDPILHVVLW